jgi:hypothetical protein
MKNLVNIQAELKVPKGNFNSFGKYKYRSAEDILEALKPILLKYKATLRLTDKIVSVGGKTFLKATATIWDEEKAYNESVGYAELSEHKGMSAEQCTGTASSYARKYALNGLFLIDETEADADSQKPANPTPEVKKPELNASTFKKMVEAINAGQGDKVKQAMPNYLISEQQKVALETALKNN